MGQHANSGHSKKQSAFTLTAIQVSGATSLPVLNSSIQLSHQYGFINAFLVLLIGNAFIWILAFMIVQMTANTTKNTLDNVKDYLGPIGSWSAGGILMASTIAYFVTQISWTTEVILLLFPFVEGFEINQFFQYSGAVGMISAVLILQGINSLRWVATISFPIIMIAFLSMLFLIPKSNPVQFTVPASLGGLAITLGTSISIAVDYPTFFQHSRSKKNSISAVTAIQIITFLIGVGGLYLGKYIGRTENLSGWDIVFEGSTLIKTLFFLLVVLSCFCVNSVNIYSASIAWELIAPKVWLGKKEYTILGFGLTIISGILTKILPMELALTLTDLPLANLCLVLVSAYLCKSIIKDFLTIDKCIICFGWLIGSIITVIAGVQSTINLYFLLLGFLFSVFIVSVVFIFRKIKYT